MPRLPKPVPSPLHRAAAVPDPDLASALREHEAEAARLRVLLHGGDVLADVHRILEDVARDQRKILARLDDMDDDGLPG